MTPVLQAMRQAALVLALVVVVSSAGAARAADAIEITAATARPTFVKNGLSAAYLVLRNRSAAPDRLLAVRTPVAVTAEVHQTIKDGEILRMRAMPSLELSPGATVTFAPGGLHVMLIGIAEPLKEADTFPLTLVFEKAGEQTITVTVVRTPQ